MDVKANRNMITETYQTGGAHLVLCLLLRVLLSKNYLKA